MFNDPTGLNKSMCFLQGWTEQQVIKLEETLNARDISSSWASRQKSGELLATWNGLESNKPNHHSCELVASGGRPSQSVPRHGHSTSAAITPGEYDGKESGRRERRSLLRIENTETERAVVRTSGTRGQYGGHVGGRRREGRDLLRIENAEVEQAVSRADGARRVVREGSHRRMSAGVAATQTRGVARRKEAPEVEGASRADLSDLVPFHRSRGEDGTAAPSWRSFSRSAYTASGRHDHDASICSETSGSEDGDEYAEENDKSWSEESAAQQQQSPAGWQKGDHSLFYSPYFRA